MQNKFAIGFTVLLGAIILTGAGCATTRTADLSPSQPVDTMEKKDTMNNEEKNTATMEKEKTMTPEEKMMAEKEAMMEKNTTGKYVDYSPTALAEATKNNGKAVLFFWASWCPDCKASNANFLANLDKIPQNVTILKTNYDTEKALKTKYGVTYQHTFIQVDGAGNQIGRWNGGSIVELISNIK